jgi:hypothetical protein
MNPGMLDRRQLAVVPLLIVLLSGCAAPAKTVVLTSIPPGATVYLQSEPIGKTPLAQTLDFSKTPSYELIASKDGYDDAVTIVTYEPSNLLTYEFRLTECTKSVSITSDPVGATVYVDGNWTGITPQRKELSFGQMRDHLLMVTKDGYEDSDVRTIRYEPRDSTDYFFRIAKQETPRDTVIKVVEVPVPDTTRYEPYMEDIECAIKVEARAQYFGRIEKVLGSPAYIRGSLSKAQADGPVLVPGQEGLDQDQLTYQQAYSLLARNSDLLDQMIHELLDTAKRDTFVFNIENPRFSADFLSTGAQAWITHTVTGKVRAGAHAFRVDTSGMRPRLSELNVDAEGQFSVPVRMSPSTRYVYIVSSYKNLVVVYKRLDVFSGVDTEMGEEQFLKDVGTTANEWRKIWEAVRK